MRTYLDCYPCFVRQALDAARLAGAAEEQQYLVLHRSLELLREIELSSTPPETGARLHRLVRQMVDHGDPYRTAKARSTEEALALYPRLEAKLAEAQDPLDVALRLSIAGNIIDFGLSVDYDLWATVERVLEQPFAIDHRDALREALAQAEAALYLGDNAGETVFDRLLIETLDAPVTYAVKGGPILNDATREDALAAGLDRVAEIVDTGSEAPGTILADCAESFRRRFEAAELVIAKGQANYETLSGVGAAGLFFLLQVKCPVIARDIGVPVGSIVLKQAFR
jgi:hypothetical protein